jgi:hypothetical protein
MVVNYNFILDDLHVAPSLEGHSQVVLKISWFLVGTAVDTAGTMHEERYSATTTIKSDVAPGEFIPFEQLTPQALQSWVEISEDRKKRNMAWIKANMIDKRLEDKVNPKVVLIKPTWLQNNNQ